MDRHELREKHKEMRALVREHHKPHLIKKAVFGLVLIAAGALLLAKNMGYLPQNVSDVIFTWPMIFVTLGFVNLFGRGFIGGLTMLLVGFYFLPLEPLGLSMDVKQLVIPVGLILVGFFILIFWKRFNPFHNRHESH